MGRSGIPKEFLKVIAPALDAGVVTLERGTRHLFVRRADGHKQMIPGSPSDWRALLNFKKQFRRFIEGKDNGRQRDGK